MRFKCIECMGDADPCFFDTDRAVDAPRTCPQKSNIKAHWKPISGGVDRSIGATTVRMCVCTDCVNNRSGLGEYACNCREIEIQDGKCRQYIKQQAPPLKIT